ncbi:MAG TPA: shikimate kinase [Phycisphaeraceae bacterium]
MNIVLIGYRGCGKTTIGKKLAHQLWKTFVDVDEQTCKRFGIDSIARIWELHGEPAWRQQEIEVTRELMARDDQVIGLGGGTLMQPDARQAVEQAAHAKRIYLYCEPEELFRRVSQDPNSCDTRPNLTPLGGGLEEIKTVLAQRDPVYRQVADAIFDVTHVSPDEAVRYLIAKYL